MVISQERRGNAPQQPRTHLARTSGRFCCLSQACAFQEGGRRGWSPSSDEAMIPLLLHSQRPCGTAQGTPSIRAFVLMHRLCTRAERPVRGDECGESGPRSSSPENRSAQLSPLSGSVNRGTPTHSPISYLRGGWLLFVTTYEGGCKVSPVWFSSPIASSRSGSEPSPFTFEVPQGAVQRAQAWLHPDPPS